MVLAVAALAVMMGSVAIALDQGSNFAGDLSDAAAGGDLLAARSLLEAGADPDEPRVHGFTPLMRAATRDDRAIVELLVEFGADLGARDLSGLTAWHLAARQDAIDALTALMGAGADLAVRSRDGLNTLDHAAQTGSLGALEMAVATGLDPNSRSGFRPRGHGYPVDEGSVPLGIAARAGQVEAVERLLEMGADVDAKSEFGQTALIMAIVAGQPPELISVLLRAGADPTVVVKCDSGCSYPEGDALEWARRLGHPDVVPLIEAALDSTG